MLQPRTQRGHDGHRQQQRRKRQEQVGRAHDQAVEAATAIAGDSAQRHPDEHREPDHQDGHDQGRPGAQDDPGIHVAAQLVGTEEVRQAGWQECVGDIDLAGVIGARVRCDEGTEDREDHQQQHDGAADDGQRITHERAQAEGHAPTDDLFPGGFRDGHQASRMRGSSHACMTSTTKLTTR